MDSGPSHYRCARTAGRRSGAAPPDFSQRHQPRSRRRQRDGQGRQACPQPHAQTTSNCARTASCRRSRRSSWSTPPASRPTISRCRSAHPQHAATEAARDDVRMFVIFWDEYHIDQFGSAVRAREQLTHFVLEAFGPTDLVALMDQLTPVRRAALHPRPPRARQSGPQPARPPRPLRPGPQRRSKRPISATGRTSSASAPR